MLGLAGYVFVAETFEALADLSRPIGQLSCKSLDLLSPGGSQTTSSSQPASYEEWSAAALAQDQKSGADAWKATDESSDYDYKVIRYRYDELVEVRKSGNAEHLLYFLNEGLHGNMGGMGSPALYKKTQLGTKNLITNYLHELVGALDDLEAVPDEVIPRREKLAYFRRASVCFGRSALMFSGAGSLGAFHIGVARELAKHNLLPRVISGASAGSLVAALIGTYQQNEVAELLDQSALLDDFAALEDTQVGPSGLPKAGDRIQIEDLQGMIAAAIPDLTFLEANELTGMHLNISVAPSELHQRSRMLNAATSPNVFIREAVLASCAIPGVFPAVTLMAKDGHQRRPYIASRKWVDGSITDDLPADRLARQYRVNHFIASQANPMVLWGLTQAEHKSDILSRFMSISQGAQREWLRSLYPLVMSTVRDIQPLNTFARVWFSLMTQEYSADINLVPEQNVLNPAKLLSRLTPEETDRLIRSGERATWPKVEMIRNCTAVSRKIDDALARLDNTVN